MVIFSIGYFDGVTLCWSWNASNKVSPPTRPKNINTIKTKCDAVLNPAVMPSDKPTVPMAEAVSNNASFTVILSNALKSIPQPKNRRIYSAVMEIICNKASSLILLRKQVMFLRFLNTENRLDTSMASVVVFKPPAVELGEPPMSIKKIIHKIVASDSVVKSAVLKPAVLVVTV